MKKESCVVLLSGGQDSATCLAWAVTKFRNIHTVSIAYGQRHEVELDYSKVLSKKAGASVHEEIPFPTLKKIDDSALLNTGTDIKDKHPGAANLPASFVPGRNFFFLGIAAAYAYSFGIRDLVTGVCQTDFSGYPDCRDTSIKAIQVALNLCLERDLTIHTPLMWKTKGETVLLMEELNCLWWYNSTHTCYEGRRPPCGVCPACKLRAAGFDSVQLPDPIYFQSQEEWESAYEVEYVQLVRRKS